MSAPQILIFSIITAILFLFLWGRLRPDLVALVALMVCVIVELVPADQAVCRVRSAALRTVDWAAYC